MRSTQAAGIVQDTFAGEAGEGEGGEEETTGGYFSQAKHLNFYHKTLACTCVLETDLYT